MQTRNVVDLLGMQPGVAPNGEVLGAKRDQNNVMLDGVDVNDPQPPSDSNGFRAALPVPLDSVQEFRTTIAGQGADQGRSSGGQVALITKSGSNDFHGSLYEFHRNKVTAANGLVQQSRRHSPREPGPQSVRRFLRRTNHSRPRLLFSELGRAERPNRQRRYSHRAHRIFQTRTRSVPHEQWPDRKPHSVGGARSGPAWTWSEQLHVRPHEDISGR